MFGDYSSVLYATSNENGQEQLEVTHYKTLFQLLFRRKAKTEVFVRRVMYWVEKDTGLVPDDAKQVELFYIRSEMQK